MNAIRSGMWLGCALILAACGGTKATLPEIAPVDDAPPATSSSSGMDSGGTGAGENLADDSGALGDTTIYFSYDESEISPAFTDELTRHARQLAARPGLRVRLEGHADERGSREYNIALGERRAQAVRRLLLIQGASAGQISTVSFGEERPAVTGSTESAYERNRRVVVAYQR